MKAIFDSFKEFSVSSDASDPVSAAAIGTGVEKYKFDFSVDKKKKRKKKKKSSHASKATYGDVGRMLDREATVSIPITFCETLFEKQIFSNDMSSFVTIDTACKIFEKSIAKINAKAGTKYTFDNFLFSPELSQFGGNKIAWSDLAAGLTITLRNEDFEHETQEREYDEVNEGVGIVDEITTDRDTNVTTTIDATSADTEPQDKYIFDENRLELTYGRGELFSSILLENQTVGTSTPAAVAAASLPATTPATADNINVLLLEAIQQLRLDVAALTRKVDTQHEMLKAV